MTRWLFGCAEINSSVSSFDAQLDVTVLFLAKPDLNFYGHGDASVQETHFPNENSRIATRCGN
jgi:hypothetical protein